MTGPFFYVLEMEYNIITNLEAQNSWLVYLLFMPYVHTSLPFLLRYSQHNLQFLEKECEVQFDYFIMIQFLYIP